MDGSGGGNAPPPPPPGFSLDTMQPPPPPSGFQMDSSNPAADIKSGGQITSPGNGEILGPGGRLDRLGHLVHGEFMSGVMNGFGGLVARKGYELAGVPEERVNTAVQSLRDEAQQEIQDSGSSGFNPAGFGASVVGSADPTYLINPGAGVAKNLGLRGAAKVAGHVVANTTAHAAFGSATDAAYQTADVLDGLQKDFDIKRNLTAAATMGAFGTAHAGLSEAAPVVSDFVQDLFKKRGVDTLPAENPKGITTPLSGQGLSPEETAQYHSVLQSGNEQEIRKFFDGRNVTPPSHADIHEWVGRRDDAANGIAPADYADPSFHPEPGPVDNRGPIQEHIANETASWKNAPDFEVINHTDEIQDPEVKQAAVAAQADNPDALGFVGPDNKVRIFANKITSGDELNAVMYHEALGHYGLAQKFGDRLDTTIQTLLKRNVGQFGRDVDQWQKDNPGAYNGDRTRAAEEVLAEMSQKGILKPSIADAVVGHVRNFGRQMGMKLSYSDAEVRNILAMSHDAVVNGKGRDVRGNGFRYMFAGEGAKTFDPQAHTNADQMLKEGRDPNEVRSLTGVHYASDKQPRMEISDDGAFIKKGALAEEGEYRLGDVLHHPRLYEAYPELKSAYLMHEPVPGFPHYAGGYDPQTRNIYVHPTNTDKLSTILHETQHAIQDIEGYSGIHSSSSAKQTYEEYKNNPLEKEAYSTEDRRTMSGMDRRGGETPKFMRRSQMPPKDVAEEAYERLDREYTPTTRTWEATAAMARDTALDPEMIRESRSVGNLDRKLFVYDAAAKQANDAMIAFAEKAKAGPLSAEDHAAAIDTAANFNYVLGRLENDSRQIARGLNAMKAVRFSRNNLLLLHQALKDGETNMEELSDPDTMLKFLKQYAGLANGGNPNGAAQMLKSISKPYWWQYLLTWRQNMMLSGLSTHLKSTMDMATMIGRELQEATIAMPGAAVRSTINALGGDVKPGVHPTEVAARLWGLTRSAMEAKTYADTFASLKKGNTQNARYAGQTDPRIPLVSKVSDLVSAQDTFFRSFLTNQNLYALGARDAYDQLKLRSHNGDVSWDDVMTQGAANARNPTQAMIDHARELTENTILLNKSPINAAIDKARQIRPGMTGYEQLGSFVTNMLTPFIRVSSNAVMNQVIRRSPLAFLDPVSRADWAAGGARRDIVVARVAMGTALLGYYWAAADPKKEKLSGEGPDNYQKMLEKQAGGWAPNAVHENGRFNQTSNLNISLNPLDLHNNTAATVAGLREAFEKGANQGQVGMGIKLALMSFMHNLSNQSFVADLAPFTDAMTNKQDTTGQKLGQFAADTAKSFLPNATNQLARQLDPNKHDTRSDSITGTVANTLQAAIPGMTNNVPIRYNVYGQPAKTGTSVTGIHTWVSNGNGQDETTDPTEKELQRLGGLTKAAIVTPTQRSIKVEGVNLKLTAAQAEEYQKFAGQTLVQAVRESMQDGSWTKMGDQDRVNYVRSTQTQAKKEVRETLLQQPGWLNKDQLSSLRSQLGGQ